jgi:hypothetical protein
MARDILRAKGTARHTLVKPGGPLRNAASARRFGQARPLPVDGVQAE